MAKVEKLIDEFEDRPIYCEKCVDEVMVFMGGGTYKCERCGEIAYDDWGKVREYLYDHANVNAYELEAELGISRKTIQRFLKEGKIQTAATRSMLMCEGCRKLISSGRFCGDCEKKFHKMIEDNARKERQNRRNIQGFGQASTADEQGRIRYESKRNE